MDSIESLEPATFLYGKYVYCGWCLHSFRCPLAAKIHFQVDHEGEPNCSCGKLFADTASLFDHVLQSGCSLPFPHEWHHFKNMSYDKATAFREFYNTEIINKPSNTEALPNQMKQCNDTSRAVNDEGKALRELRADEITKSSPMKYSTGSLTAVCDKTKTQDLKESICDDVKVTLKSKVESNNAVKKEKRSAAEMNFLRSCFAVMSGGLIRCRLCSHVYVQWKTAYQHVGFAHKDHLNSWQCSMPNSTENGADCGQIIKSENANHNSLTPVAADCNRNVPKRDSLGRFLKSALKKQSVKTETHAIVTGADCSNSCEQVIDTSIHSVKAAEASCVCNKKDQCCMYCMATTDNVNSNNFSSRAISSAKDFKLHLSVTSNSGSNLSLSASSEGLVIGSDYNSPMDAKSERFQPFDDVKTSRPLSQCPYCNCSFSGSTVTYQRHLKNDKHCSEAFSYVKSQCQILADGRFQCRLCKLSISNRSRIYKHVRCVHWLSSSKVGAQSKSSKSLTGSATSKADRSPCQTSKSQQLNILNNNMVKSEDQRPVNSKTGKKQQPASRKLLVKFRRNVPSGKFSPLKCLSCHKEFKWSSNLSRHKKMCHAKEVLRVKRSRATSVSLAAETSGDCSMSKDQAVDETKVPVNEESGTKDCHCRYCGRNFYSNSNRRRHEEDVCSLRSESTEPPAVESDCKSMPVNKRSKKSIARCIKRNGSLYCSLCGYRGKNVKSIYFHIRYSTRLPHTPSTIKILPSMIDDDNHQWYVKVNEKSLKCRFCFVVYNGKRIATARFRMMKHVRRKHAAIIDSDNAYVTFTNQVKSKLERSPVLKKAMKRSGCPGKSFSCGKCGRSFHLLAVRSKHEGICKGYQYYAELAYLTSQCRLDSDGRTLCCICGHDNSFRGDVYKHIRAVHGIPAELTTAGNTSVASETTDGNDATG